MAMRIPTSTRSRSMISCADRLEVMAVPGVPLVERGDDLPALFEMALRDAHVSLADGDVLVVASKLVSRAEGRFVDLARVEPSPRAAELARVVKRDPRLLELVLR